MPFQLVHYSQQDPQWKNDRLGFGGASETIGFVGCALTCVAMVSSGHGFPDTPRSMNQKIRSRNGFVHAAVVWGTLSSIYPPIKSKPLILCADTDAPLAQIDAAIAAGQPVIVQLDQGPAAGLQTHWVVLYEKQGDDYLMLDPWPHPTESGQSVLLLPRYGHGKSLKQAITAVVMYECLTSGGVTIPTPPGPVPVSTGVFVQVLADAPAGLRLRSQPTTESATLAIEPPLTRLEIIQAGDQANIGKANQWLHVRDEQGLEGCVAAWFVEPAAALPPAPPTGPAPSPAPHAPAPVPPVTPPPATPPASTKLTLSVRLTVGANGLRLRKVPSLAGALLAVEKAGTRLTVLEPAQAAKAKIGTTQWVYVRDPKGRRGYVIGEFVELV
ncbi:MAG TPA: C39 family peptidase [Anaerolineales bacterium]|jgi:hypothetical protein